MIRISIILAAILSLILFSWQDILIWQRVIERNDLYQYALGIYHDGWRVMRDALYWLDGRALPARLPWLDTNDWLIGKPITDAILVANVTVWIIGWAVLWLILKVSLSARWLRAP